MVVPIGRGVLMSEVPLWLLPLVEWNISSLKFPVSAPMVHCYLIEVPLLLCDVPLSAFVSAGSALEFEASSSISAQLDSESLEEFYMKMVSD